MKYDGDTGSFQQHSHVRQNSETSKIVGEIRLCYAFFSVNSPVKTVVKDEIEIANRMIVKPKNQSQPTA